jgi:hypothetical protein
MISLVLSSWLGELFCIGGRAGLATVGVSKDSEQGGPEWRSGHIRPNRRFS